MTKWTSEEKIALLAEWHRRGVAAKDFCSEKGLIYPTFMEWKRHYGYHATPEAPVFVELTKQLSRAVVDMGTAFLRVERAGVSIEVHGTVDPGYVASVLDAVGYY